MKISRSLVMALNKFADEVRDRTSVAPENHSSVRPRNDLAMMLDSNGRSNFQLNSTLCFEETTDGRRLNSNLAAVKQRSQQLAEDSSNVPDSLKAARNALSGRRNALRRLDERSSQMLLALQRM